MLSCPNTLAQTSTAFVPADKFDIPANNGAINFAVNGSYSTATFEGSTWTFTNLLINGSEPLQNLEISTENSNVTIFSYHTRILDFPSDQLRYFVQGRGQQIINIGVGLQGESNVDWVVSSNRSFISNGWTVSHNGTVTLTGLTGNISITYFGFTNQLTNSNLPFYEQHSVAIAVAVLFAVTVAVAITVAVKRRSSAGETISDD